ncbi:hypothetical protein L7F22_015100 [Adiantum nelumboides]|nr:hypothetical protein [Adiantum nelumboides]
MSRGSGEHKGMFFESAAEGWTFRQGRRVQGLIRAAKFGISSELLDANINGARLVAEQDSEEDVVLPNSIEDFPEVSEFGFIHQEGGKSCHDQWHVKVHLIPESVGGREEVFPIADSVETDEDAAFECRLSCVEEEKEFPLQDCDAYMESDKFPERRISFKFREKNMYIDAQESGNTIPPIHTHAFDKSIKSSISMYMIFVKDSLSDVNKTQVNESGSQEDLELSKFLNQFQDVFIEDIPGELPPKRGDDDHVIELIPGSSPPNKPPYRVSRAQQEESMRQVNELVEKGMVRPSSFPFCSPVLLVHKKDGTYRMCVDYRALNKITIKNRLLVPRIEDLFYKLQGSTYFNTMDLKSGYHQIRIVNEDILKTAFCITFGLYEYLVMPFGLTNAPATFNCMMEQIFRPHCNFTGVFFDDVIIYSKSMEEHKKHLLGIYVRPGFLDARSIEDCVGSSKGTDVVCSITTPAGVGVVCSTTTTATSNSKIGLGYSADLYAGQNEENILCLRKELESNIMQEDDDMNVFLTEIKDLKE